MIKITKVMRCKVELQARPTTSSLQKSMAQLEHLMIEYREVISTHGIFLGFWFLVRNEEKNEIPCRGTRKIRGISVPIFLPVFVCTLDANHPYKCHQRSIFEISCISVMITYEYSTCNWSMNSQKWGFDDICILYGRFTSRVLPLWSVSTFIFYHSLNGRK